MGKNISPLELKNYTGLFIFKIDSEDFCIDIEEVIKVIKPGECTIPFNQTDSDFKFDGKLYPIIQIDKVFNLKYKNSPEARIILIRIKNKLYGLFVDKISEVIAIKDNRDTSMTLYPINAPLLSGIVKYDGKEISLPNYEQLVLHHI